MDKKTTMSESDGDVFAFSFFGLGFLPFVFMVGILKSRSEFTFDTRIHRERESIDFFVCMLRRVPCCWCESYTVLAVASIQPTATR